MKERLNLRLLGARPHTIVKKRDETDSVAEDPYRFRACPSISFFMLTDRAYNQKYERAQS